MAAERTVSVGCSAQRTAFGVDSMTAIRAADSPGWQPRSARGRRRHPAPPTRLTLAAGAAFLVAAAGVQSQQAPGPQPDVAEPLAQIVVTARARAESVQTVPLAITAFSGEDLRKNAVRDMQSLSRQTPGFSFESYGGNGSTSPVIRGATQIAGSLEQPVSFFLDGVYLPRSYVTDLGFWGMDRVEVVEGPQSARYGRNAFMGAVNYVSRKPGSTWRIEAEGTAGNYSRYDESILASGPVVEGKLAVLAGIYHSTFDGSWQNSDPYCDIHFAQGTGCRLGGWGKTTWTAAIRATPTDQLTIEGSYYNFKSNQEQAAITYFGELNADSNLMNCGAYNPTVRPLARGGLGAGGQWYRLYCGSLLSNVIAVDPRGYGNQLNADFVRAGLTYSFPHSITFTYTYGRVAASSYVNIYNDIIPGCTYFIPGACVFSNVGASSNRTESHDARLTYDDGTIRAAVGYLYAPSQDLSLSAFATAPQLTAVPSAPLYPNVPSGYRLYVPLGQNMTQNQIYSPFAELSVSLLDKRLRLGAEGRYSRENRYQQALSSGGAGGVLVFSGAAYRATYKYFTPRVTVDYDLTKNNLLYASAARGEKAGGFNPTAFQPEFRVYNPDTNWTYEIGSKNTFGNLRLNAAVFLWKWKNMQIPAADPGNPAPLPVAITLNLGNVTGRGFEGQAEYAVTRNLTVDATLYYGKSTFDSGTYDLVWARSPAVCDNVVCPTNGYIGGNNTPRAPQVMATAGAQWRGSLPHDLDYYINGDLTYQSKAYVDEMNLAWVASRVISNTSFGLTAGHYEVQFWVRNLFDRKYIEVASVQQPNVTYNGAMGDRRTLGVTVRGKL